VGRHRWTLAQARTIHEGAFILKRAPRVLVGLSHQERYSKSALEGMAPIRGGLSATQAPERKV
jgi:hypothetical protein